MGHSYGKERWSGNENEEDMRRVRVKLEKDTQPRRLIRKSSIRGFPVLRIFAWCHL